MIPTAADTASYYLAYHDIDGPGIEEEYFPLGAAVDRAQAAQRAIEARGNTLKRRYEVRERVYGRVVWRAIEGEGRRP